MQPFCCDCYSLDNIVEHLRLDLYLHAQKFSFYFQFSTVPFNPHFEYILFSLGFQTNSKSKARLLFIGQLKIQFEAISKRIILKVSSVETKISVKDNTMILYFISVNTTSLSNIFVILQIFNMQVRNNYNTWNSITALFGIKKFVCLYVYVILSCDSIVLYTLIN